MTEVTGKLTGCRLSLLEFDFYVVRHVSVRHQAVDMLPRLETGGGDPEILQNEIPVMAVFDRDTEDEILKGNSDKDDSDRQWEFTEKTDRYVRVVLAVSEANREHLTTV